MRASAQQFKPGDWVVSRYRAPWKGVVIEYDKTISHCVRVEIMIDSHDKPTKISGWRKFKAYDQHWFKLIKR